MTSNRPLLIFNWIESHTFSLSLYCGPLFVLYSLYIDYFAKNRFEAEALHNLDCWMNESGIFLEKLKWSFIIRMRRLSLPFHSSHSLCAYVSSSINFVWRKKSNSSPKNLICLPGCWCCCRLPFTYGIFAWVWRDS